jgi:hypothetical protein
MLTIAETKLDESLVAYEFKSPSIRILSYFTDSWSKVTKFFITHGGGSIKSTKDPEVTKD